MSRGLYTVAEVARYLAMRPQEVARMIKDDALPAVKLPSAKREVMKITLHGLHEWLSGRHSGARFMSVEDLAMEIEAANVEGSMSQVGMLQLRSAVEGVFQMIKRSMGEAETPEPPKGGTTLLGSRNGLKPELRTKTRRVAA